MLYKFKSRAAADLILLEPHARTILQIIGKEAGPTGVITVAQIPAAIAALQAGVAADEARLRDIPPVEEASSDPEAATDDDRREVVRLHQRAAPFIDLLRRSLEEGRDVVWGV